MSMTWHLTTATIQPDGVIVDTKVTDAQGERNHQKLYRCEVVAWLPPSHKAMYIYNIPINRRNLK